MKVFCIALCLVVVFSLGEAKSVPNVRKIRSLVNSFIPDMSRFTRELTKMRVERDTEEDVDEAIGEFIDALAELEDDDKKRDASSDEDDDISLEDLFDLDKKRAAPKRKAAAPRMAVKRANQAKRIMKDFMPRMMI